MKRADTKTKNTKKKSKLKPSVKAERNARESAILKRLPGPPDEGAIETVDKFMSTPKAQLTTGEIQSSFHEAERQLTRDDYQSTFPIVAIGASAGGIESFSELLKEIPADTGMAFILIQHLSPRHESLLPVIMSRATEMRVTAGASDMEIEPNVVYVIPPNTNMGIIRGHLKLIPRMESPGRHMPVDFFFRCLADDQNALGIGVVLSGADGDGAQGLRAVRAQGGLTFVQDPKTAKVDGMPRNAIAAEGTDTVLPIKEIAAELVRIAHHPYARADQKEQMRSGHQLAHVFTMLNRHTGVDFSKYKPGTVNRRLRRRVLLHKAQDINEYLSVLEKDRTELDELYRDLLINVTSFFRDAYVYDFLHKNTFRKLINRTPDNGTLRVWVPGCATGEEAYSIAMVLLETMEEVGRIIPFQIFASDLSERSLTRAREATYGFSITADVSPERLRRFFIKVPNGYRVVPSLRECCIFARHDLLRDPPFSRMDVISCRNLLIYILPEQQKRIMNMFAYALNPKGYLILGSSETTASADGFELVSKTNKIFIRKSHLPRLHLELLAANPASEVGREKVASKPTDFSQDVDREVTNLLLERFAPAAVIVDSTMHIVQIRGSTGDYLELPNGPMTPLNVFKMFRSGLELEIRVLLKKCEKYGKPQTRENFNFRRGKHVQKLTLEVLRLPGRHKADEAFYVILFIDRERQLLAKRQTVRIERRSASQRAEDEAQVREELDITRDHLQSIIRQQELTNEELQAANEEILSSNEELQSTNEELETAKEELQSTNEELTTVNDELSDRNSQLVNVNNDLNNFLGSVNLPIAMVGNDLRIRRFTPMAERVLNLIPSDVGRPITDMKPNIDVPDLEQLIVQTIETMQTVEREVQDRAGHWYSFRIRPYRTEDNKIDGAVLILVDIGFLKTHLSNGAKTSSPYAIADSIDQPVVYLSPQFRVLQANQAFYNLFQLAPDALGNSNFFEIDKGSWADPVLKALLSEVIATDSQIVDYRISYLAVDKGTKSFKLNARKIRREGQTVIMIILDQIQIEYPAD